MLSDRDVSAAIGTTAYDPDGGKLGTVEHFFIDDRTGLPSWVAVTTGLFGTRTSVVPVQGAAFTDGRLVLPVSREAVRSAPETGGSGHLDPGEEANLRRHYGLEGAEPRDAAWTPTGTGLAPAGAAPDDVPAGPAAAPVGPAAAPVGPATRLRAVKYVVTEEVQLTVPIRREEIRFEEVPLGVPDPGPGEFLVPPSEGRHALADEILLHAERPVVSLELVPTERVRLGTEVVDGQERVTGQVQREWIGTDQQPTPRG